MFFKVFYQIKNSKNQFFKLEKHSLKIAKTFLEILNVCLINKKLVNLFYAENTIFLFLKIDTNIYQVTLSITFRSLNLFISFLIFLSLLLNL